MHVLQVVVKTTNPRSHHVSRHVVVDRDDGHLVHEKPFGMLEDLDALRFIRLMGSVRNQLVILGVAETGAVVLATRNEHIEVRVGVDVITNPCPAGDKVLKLLLRILKRRPFFGVKRSGNAQRVLPLFAQQLGDYLMLLVVVVEDFELGEAFAIRKTGFGEQFLCRGRIWRLTMLWLVVWHCR